MRVLVVDDSLVFRHVLSTVFQAFSGVTGISTANNGKIALAKIASFQPDLVTLDIEMPEMNGLQVLRHIQQMPRPPAVVVVSNFTEKGSPLAVQALQMGALDAVSKPQGRRAGDAAQEMASTLAPLASVVKSRLVSDRKQAPRQEQLGTATSPSGLAFSLSRPRCEIVAIGASTGGPAALSQLVSQLPGDFPIPLVTVVHMPRLFTANFARSLDERSPLSVREGQDGVWLESGTFYLAPGGRQMRVARKDHAFVLEITDDPPENSCRPSVDYLFRSVARTFGSAAMGVILTGMGKDGVLGLATIKQVGGRTVAQDRQSSAVFGMPMEAIRAGAADLVVPLAQLPQLLAGCTAGVP